MSKSKKKKKKAKEIQEASNNSDFEISSSTRDNIIPGKTPGRPDSLRQGLFISKNENVLSKISSSTKPALEKRKPKGSWMVDRIGNLSDNEEGKVFSENDIADESGRIDDSFVSDTKRDNLVDNEKDDTDAMSITSNPQVTFTFCQ